ncbi:WXG100 family type VII secretion target [Rhodococcus cercidiphylli]|uniref:WXG100 family type VII secretion target n=1 Tax=Rhodococcus cercidiphylli TaxID=489916 RepID=A0ABU4B3G7_9NOCA|nr:WXG100 family type VII secretion target [Rhodococcus cercidiphylli]MDV6233043.1 WXG100 family type VII secretion target [Rhodococcus cercidiphylli]
MTEPEAEFAVQLGDLETLVLRLDGLIESVDRNVAELSAQAASVRSWWTGEAADAYTERHHAWHAAVSELTDEIFDVQARLRNAHHQYSDAVVTNLKMLGRE